jgi:hypothetical protein
MEDVQELFWRLPIHTTKRQLGTTENFKKMIVNLIRLSMHTV